MTDAEPSTATGTGATGTTIPPLGLGTWQNTDPEQCAESVRTALEMGYRHVDTAQVYGNEAAVGEGLARANVDREDVFLATKLWTSDLAAEDVPTAARESLDRLGVDSVDLLYVHWPAETYDPEETLPAMAALREEGLIEHVGVSNFEPDQLATAIEVCPAPILANQIEVHPYLPQNRLLAACRDHDVAAVAYSPLARGRVFDDPTITDIAARHDVSQAQVTLAWLVERGCLPIPKATGVEHIRDNWAAVDLELTDADVAAIDAIETRSRTVDPDHAPWN